MKVEGIRRVWGTMKVCTETSIKSEIARCCATKTIRVREKKLQRRHALVVGDT